MRYLAISLLIHSLFLFALKTIGDLTDFKGFGAPRSEILYLTLVSPAVSTELKKSHIRKGFARQKLAKEKATEGDWPLYMPPPPYPKQAKEKGWAGEVILELKTDQAGYVSSLKVLSGSGYHLLDQEAYKAVKGWRLAPGLFARVPIVFRLRSF
ncbi:MAG: energy transducer TonB [Deltaproteobacteria bacterium]